MKYRLAALLSVAVIATFCIPAYTAPEAPEGTTEWELSIDLQPLQSIQLTLPGDKAPQTYWFLRYTVTNETGADQSFTPEFALYTDMGEVITAGRSVSPAVFKKIKESYNDPLLKDATGMLGKILQGEDNAKSGVAIFKNFDPKAGTVEIFVGGLSGHAETIKLPVPVTVKETDAKGKSKDVEKTEITLVKTLHLKYRHPLDPTGKVRENELKLVKKDWVMR